MPFPFSFNQCSCLFNYSWRSILRSGLQQAQHLSPFEDRLRTTKHDRGHDIALSQIEFDWDLRDAFFLCCRGWYGSGYGRFDRPGCVNFVSGPGAVCWWFEIFKDRNSDHISILIILWKEMWLTIICKIWAILWLGSYFFGVLKEVLPTSTAYSSALWLLMFKTT